jgi:hypothetical protein
MRRHAPRASCSCRSPPHAPPPPRRVQERFTYPKAIVGLGDHPGRRPLSAQCAAAHAAAAEQAAARQLAPPCGQRYAAAKEFALNAEAVRRAQEAADAQERVSAAVDGSCPAGGSCARLREGTRHSVRPHQQGRSRSPSCAQRPCAAPRPLIPPSRLSLFTRSQLLKAGQTSPRRHREFLTSADNPLASGWGAKGGGGHSVGAEGGPAAKGEGEEEEEGEEQRAAAEVCGQLRPGVTGAQLAEQWPRRWHGGLQPMKLMRQPQPLAPPFRPPAGRRRRAHRRAPARPQPGRQPRPRLALPAPGRRRGAGAAGPHARRRAHGGGHGGRHGARARAGGGAGRPGAGLPSWRAGARPGMGVWGGAAKGRLAGRGGGAGDRPGWPQLQKGRGLGGGAACTELAAASPPPAPRSAASRWSCATRAWTCRCPALARSAPAARGTPRSPTADGRPRGPARACRAAPPARARASFAPRRAVRPLFVPIGCGSSRRGARGLTARGRVAPPSTLSACVAARCGGRVAPPNSTPSPQAHDPRLSGPRPPSFSSPAAASPHRRGRICPCRRPVPQASSACLAHSLRPAFGQGPTPVAPPLSPRPAFSLAGWLLLPPPHLSRSPTRAPARASAAAGARRSAARGRRPHRPPRGLRRPLRGAAPSPLRP